MIQDDLFALQDKQYKEFSSKLMPSVATEKVIGIRTPALRQYAKQIDGSTLALQFLKQLPHEYFEENNLHAFLLEQFKDYEECIKCLNEFLPYIDNWATCDCFNPKCFKKNLPSLIDRIKTWIASEHTYTKRYGIVMLMRYYLEPDTFKPEYLDIVAAIRSEEYYIKMAQAWYFATALAKQYAATLPIISQQRLDTWTHNKTIQKAKESFRVSPEQKAELQKLKINGKSR